MTALTEAERVYRHARGAYEIPEWVTSAQKAADWVDQALSETSRRNAYVHAIQTRLFSENSAMSFAEQAKKAEHERAANMFAEKFLVEGRLRKHYGGGATEQTGRQIMNPVEAFHQSYESDKPKLEQEATATEKIKESCEPPVIEQIEIAPGFGMLHFLGHFCQKNFRERVLEALHAEALADYQEALKRGDLVRATTVKRMMHFWMVWAMIGGVISWVGGKLSLKIGSGE